MGVITPRGKFRVENRDGRVFFYPESLEGLGVVFVAERKDGQFLLHDDGTLMKAVLDAVGDTVDVVRELRFGSRAEGFHFREGRVYVKVSGSRLGDMVRKMERFAVEVFHKTTKGLGE